jgi:hypothetical protein
MGVNAEHSKKKRRNHEKLSDTSIFNSYSFAFTLSCDLRAYMGTVGNDTAFACILLSLQEIKTII